MRVGYSFVASIFAPLFLNFHCGSANEQSVGYPIFIASFDEHGDQRRVESDVKHYEVVDTIITDMFQDCPSRYYIVIKDMTFFDEIDLNILKKHTQSSMTVASFLTDLPLQIKYLAEDLSKHCNAELVNLEPHEEDFVPVFSRNNPKVYYIEFDSSDEIDKSKALKAILKTLHGPHTTIIYQNYFSSSTPIFGDIEVSQQRRDYDKKKRVRRVKPTIAPLDGVTTRAGFPGPATPSVSISVPQNVFSDDTLKLVILGSFALLVLLVIKDLVFTGSPSKKLSNSPKEADELSKNAESETNDPEDEKIAVSGVHRSNSNTDLKKRKPQTADRE